ncbi:MurT ligase domain-containing protein [Collinsella vaginalis]|uniref:MurT ligase domain-containing protein n=1 Tax=Collinsella vaginalis TaxID=1870987 RepID=UPI000A26ED50|nr:MurT ligase domain-containing protein [Collinsella vaginalis]
MGTSPRFLLGLAAAKASIAALRVTRHSGGQVPGVVAEAIDRTFLADMPKPARIAFVSGTNGKTTTCNLLADLLLDNGVDLVTNRAGGNIVTGIESTLIKNATITGKPRVDCAVMELDEISFRTVMPHVDPELLLVTNLYGDTFTRSADPAYVFDVMSAHIPARTRLVLNADDLISCRLAPHNTNKVFFSIGRMPFDTAEPEGIVCDLTACPDCGGRLEYDYCHLRHLGRAHCAVCGLESPAPDYEVVEIDRQARTFTVKEHLHPGTPQFTYPLSVHSVANIYNVLAAVVTAREMGLTGEQIVASLAGGVSVTAARFQAREAGGKRILTIASKGENATAASVAFNTIRKEPGTKAVAVIISDSHMAEVPEDVEYTGWYYQADFEYLNDPQIKQVIVYGATSDDIMLRLATAGVDPAITKVARSEAEIADLFDLDAVDGAYIAHCVTNVGISHRVADKLVDRARRTAHV